MSLVQTLHGWKKSRLPQTAILGLCWGAWWFHSKKLDWHYPDTSMYLPGPCQLCWLSRQLQVSQFELMPCGGTKRCQRNAHQQHYNSLSRSTGTMWPHAMCHLIHWPPLHSLGKWLPCTFCCGQCRSGDSQWPKCWSDGQPLWWKCRSGKHYHQAWGQTSTEQWEPITSLCWVWYQRSSARWQGWACPIATLPYGWWWEISGVQLSPA